MKTRAELEAKIAAQSRHLAEMKTGFAERLKSELEKRNCALQNTNRELLAEITERAGAEKRIERAASEWRATFDAITDMVSIQDQGFRLTRLNRAFADCFGYAPADLIGKVCYQIVHCRSEPIAECPHRLTLQTGKTHTREFYEAGMNAYVEVTTSPIFGEGGTVTASVHVIRDVTERKRALDALRESEERYRTLLELGGEVGEAIVMLQDTELKEAVHSYVSEQWVHLTGYQAAELMTMSFFELLHPRDVAGSRERHRRKMCGEVISGLYEMTVISKDGHEVPIELTSAGTTYKGQAADVSYIRDITERKQMAQRLIIADRLASIGELASGIAHELNNPLTSIIGFSQLLLDRETPAEIADDLRIISGEAERAAGVVKNLLTFARKHAPAKRLIDVREVIRNVLKLRNYEQKVSNIRVKTRLADNLPRIMADYFQLQQVFLNIVINAEHFMLEAHNKGTLTVSTRRKNDWVEIIFADDGPGIPTENLKHLFDPFFTTKEVGKGTGLGLSICHGIITGHGGEITAEGNTGRGATFIIRLPTGDR